jgi:superfamily II DNA or RNA helicase
MLLTFPHVFGIDTQEADNPIQQIAELKHQQEGNLATFTSGRTAGTLFRPDEPDQVLILASRRQVRDGFQRILIGSVNVAEASNDLSAGKWEKHPLLSDREDETDYAHEIATVFDSWQDAFSYVEEDPARDVVGLRRPQLGAVHATHAHWTVSNSVGTIVMPTGTGKTETMLSLLVSMRCEKLLVIVPTDALRSQLAQKFLTLGVLKSSRSTVLKSSAKTPIVCTLLHMPPSPEEVDRIFTRAHVIVTTSHIAGQCDRSVQERMARHCPYLFIDEAHHAEAPTWGAFKDRFRDRRVLQFTATPFREDGRPLDGQIIFKYPLKLAQDEGYFAPIHFEPVVEFNRSRADRVIAEKAIEQLRRDYDKGTF